MPLPTRTAQSIDYSWTRGREDQPAFVGVGNKIVIKVAAAARVAVSGEYSSDRFRESRELSRRPCRMAVNS